MGKEGEDACRHDKWCCMMYPRLTLLRGYRENQMYAIRAPGGTGVSERAVLCCSHLCNTLLRYLLRNISTFRFILLAVVWHLNKYEASIATVLRVHFKHGLRCCSAAAFLKDVASQDTNRELVVYCERLAVHQEELRRFHREHGKRIRPMLVPFGLK